MTIYYTLDLCHTQDSSYDCCAKYTIGLLQRLTVLYTVQQNVKLYYVRNIVALPRQPHNKQEIIKKTQTYIA